MSKHKEKTLRPIGIDLFAGAGGMSLGFEQAGFDVVAAVEVDPVHCAVHEFNFPNCAILPHSVEHVTAEQIREQADIGDRQIDCVFGGPPCQGFSMIGHRALDDSRNQLVAHFVRLVKELDARSFVFENVKGLTVGKHKNFLYELVEEFKNAGYDCRIPWKVLNAAHYGTPQSRERLILLGCKKGEKLPFYPTPKTNIPGKSKKFPDLPYGPTCSDALNDLPDADQFATLLSSDSVKISKFKSPSTYAKKLRCLTNEAWDYGYPREWDPSILTSSARTRHTDISKSRFSETTPGTVEPISRFFRLSDKGVSNTLRAGTDGSRGAFTSPRPIHYKFSRCITVREMARLHGFPDWFRFNATKWHGGRQIGNAVPPPLSRAIASSVIEALNLSPKSPVESLKLGDTSLLEFNITDAAKHFDIKAPPSKRDRKSGAKKRKQVDIERERLASKL
jgi:DNA (cytosine-5)-methyltransferase 1